MTEETFLDEGIGGCRHVVIGATSDAPSARGRHGLPRRLNAATAPARRRRAPPRSFHRVAASRRAAGLGEKNAGTALGILERLKPSEYAGILLDRDLEKRVVTQDGPRFNGSHVVEALLSRSAVQRDSPDPRAFDEREARAGDGPAARGRRLPGDPNSHVGSHPRAVPRVARRGPRGARGRLSPRPPSRRSHPMSVRARLLWTS